MKNNSKGFSIVEVISVAGFIGLITLSLMALFKNTRMLAFKGRHLGELQYLVNAVHLTVAGHSCTDNNGNIRLRSADNSPATYIPGTPETIDVNRFVFDGGAPAWGDEVELRAGQAPNLPANPGEEMLPMVIDDLIITDEGVSLPKVDPLFPGETWYTVYLRVNARKGTGAGNNVSTIHRQQFYERIKMNIRVNDATNDITECDFRNSDANTKAVKDVPITRYVAKVGQTANYNTTYVPQLIYSLYDMQIQCTTPPCTAYVFAQLQLATKNENNGGIARLYINGAEADRSQYALDELSLTTMLFATHQIADSNPVDIDVNTMNHANNNWTRIGYAHNFYLTGDSQLFVIVTGPSTCLSNC